MATMASTIWLACLRSLRTRPLSVARLRRQCRYRPRSCCWVWGWRAWRQSGADAGAGDDYTRALEHEPRGEIAGEFGHGSIAVPQAPGLSLGACGVLRETGTRWSRRSGG